MSNAFEPLPIPGVSVIGLGHKARHGKDSVARFIVEAMPHAARTYSFAAALRVVARVAFGMTEKDAPLLQVLGTDVMRLGKTVTLPDGRVIRPVLSRPDPDIWLKALYWQITEERPSLAVITDVRFPNEGRMVQAMGGRCIRVTRYTKDGQPFVAPDRDPCHTSETAMDDYAWDAELGAFDGRLEALRSAVIPHVQRALALDVCDNHG